MSLSWFCLSSKVKWPYLSLMLCPRWISSWVSRIWEGLFALSHGCLVTSLFDGFNNFIDYPVFFSLSLLRQEWHFLAAFSVLRGDGVSVAHVNIFCITTSDTVNTCNQNKFPKTILILIFLVYVFYSCPLIYYMLFYVNKKWWWQPP